MKSCSMNNIVLACAAMLESETRTLFMIYLLNSYSLIYKRIDQYARKYKKDCDDLLVFIQV